MEKDRMIYQVDSTREKILQCATLLFEENGFFETQMKDVAHMSGLSRNTLYRYFGDKNDLAFAVIMKTISDHNEKTREIFASVLEIDGLNSLEKLKKILIMGWMSMENKLDNKLVSEFDTYYSGSRVTETMKERFQKLKEIDFKEDILFLIEEGQKEGCIRSDVDPHLTFVTILNSIRALNQRVLLRGEVLYETNRIEAQQMPPQLLDILMAGLKGENYGK